MVPRAVTLAALDAPDPRPLLLTARSSPAPRSYSYGSGAISGSVLTYQDLASFAWHGLPDPLVRLRSNVQESAGDILTGLKAVDVGASEAFLLRTLPLGSPIAFESVLRPGAPLYAFYPVRKLAEEALDQYAYETKLSRLSRTNPPAFLRRAPEVIENREALTGQEWLTALFGVWAGAFPWFTFKPVPRMLLNAPDGPLEPELAAMSVAQSEPRSMRAILDDVLGVFVGYTLRVDADNDVVLVPPPWHPDAANALELSYADLYTLPLGEVDALSVVNRATVRSQGWEFIEEQEVAPPSYLVRHSQSQPILTELHTTGAAAQGATYVPTQDLPEGLEAGYKLTFVTPAGENVVVTIASEASFNNNGITTEPLPAALPDRSVADFSPRDREEVGESLWRFGSDEGGVLVGGDELDITFHLRMYESDRVIRPSGYWDLTLQYDVLETVKLKRQKTQVIERRHAQGPDMVFRVALTWSERGVDVQVLYFSTGEPAEDSRYAYRLDLNAHGAKWGRSQKTVSATWGEENISELPGAQESRDTFGEITATLQSDTFPLDAEQCLQVARGLVAANLHPKKRYALEQSTWNAFLIGGDVIGRKVRLPNGEEGVVESVDYADAFEFDAAFVASSFEVVVTEPLV